MKYHLIGVGGTGMGALAGLLHAAGHEVRGSDHAVYPPMSDQLRALGIPVAEGFREENLDWAPDRVVVGNVCPKDHLEVVAAQARGLTLTSLPATLEEVFLQDRHAVVVAGTHGKTSTSSLLAHILMTGQLDPSFFIGGVPVAFGRGWRLGGGAHFLLEGDEYDSAFFDKGSKFLHYRPRTAVLTSVELDHVDIFASMDEVRAAFRAFVELIPEDGLLIVAASSPEALAIAEHARCRVETYAADGREPDGVTATWRTSAPELLGGGRCSFQIHRNGESFGRVETNLFGDHNHENIVATVAAALAVGVPADTVRKAVAQFAGVRRRQEVRGVARGTYVVDDYAHHPTAVAETLKGLRGRFQGRRLIAIFEPRSATSRRRTFQHEFADAFAHADKVVVGRLHASDGIPPDQRLDPEKLALDIHRSGTPAVYLADVQQIIEHVRDMARPGDVIIVFSSGSFESIHQRLLTALGDPVSWAAAEDLVDIRDLLDRSGLPWKDLQAEEFRNFMVLRNETGFVGCIGLEPYGEDAILRSLAVSKQFRGQGYGWILADNAISVARHRGAKRIYLLTETASDFFAEKLGFRVVDRATVSDAVAQSTSFKQQRGRGVTTMRLDL